MSIGAGRGKVRCWGTAGALLEDYWWKEANAHDVVLGSTARVAKLSRGLWVLNHDLGSCTQPGVYGEDWVFIPLTANSNTSKRC